MTGRRILFFLTYLSGRRASYLASGQITVDDGQTNSVGQITVDDGQTNSVLFDLSVWPSNAIPSRWTSDGVDDGQTNFVLFD